jgi:hypothetical protein
MLLHNEEIEVGLNCGNVYMVGHHGLIKIYVTARKKPSGKNPRGFFAFKGGHHE